ncbi:MAG: hypothetical protein AAB267_02780, partial [Candidatus Desantisbacteria bacterium]
NVTKIISIDANLKKGSKYDLSYEFDAPDVSPEFYLLGPLDIGAFKEMRNWQIASDQAAGFNFSYPDAGAPGMNLVVSIVGTGFAISDKIITNSSGNVTIGPIVVTDANGRWTTSLGAGTNGVLTTVFYIHPNATDQDVQINISGVKLPSVFKIISPAKGSGNFSGAAAGTYMIGNGRNGTRTARGTIVLDELIIPSGVTVVVNTTDIDDNSLSGNQGFFPVTIVVNGTVNISGTLNVSGNSGLPNSGENGGSGGNGGPGGGGGGGGGSDRATVAFGQGGSGFTGGGSGGEDTFGSEFETAGGNGTGSLGGAATAASFGGSGGNSTSPQVTGGGGGASGAAGGGGGGGTGFFFGSSGGGGTASAGTDGSGGGGGGSNAGGAGSGGGFGTSGTSGLTHGNAHLFPLTGGSGGGGGGSGGTSGSSGGGGGGGAVLIVASENITIMPAGQILAMGGDGQTAGDSAGGAGSGGAIVLQAFNVSIYGGVNASAGKSGTAGGLGRIRVDGLENPGTVGSLDMIAGSNFTGPAIKNITDASIGGTANASAQIIIYVRNETHQHDQVSNNKTILATADSDGKFDIAVTWFTGKNYIAVIQNSTDPAVNGYTVMGSGAIATYYFKPFVDEAAPIINGTINNTAPKFGEVINATYNITDVGGTLSTGNISINISGNPVQNFSFILSSTRWEMSQNITVNRTRGTILNITGFAFDGTNIVQNSTLITVANTPAGQATIVLPADKRITNLQPLALNVTFARDPDGDVINVTYYINGIRNQTQLGNTTFNASDGTYILNVSLHDNVVPLTYSANASVNFTIDTIVPVANATMNKSFTNMVFGDVINLTANATDNLELSFGQIIVNASPSGSSLTRIFNFSLNRESAAQFSQNISIDCYGGCVINFTARVNDTAGNFRTNDTIITVLDNIAPIVNVSINNTSPKINEWINISANITDETGLATANITINFSTGKVYMNYTLSGKSQTINNATQITDIRGHVLNITVYATDTTNNVKQNSTLITVANTPAGQATIVLPADKRITNLQPLALNVTFARDPDGDVINVTYYINGIRNQTQLGNTTFNASDGTYILNVSLHDNVVPLTYSANASVNFTIDTIVPVANATMNKSFTNMVFGDVINLTANATDNLELSFGQIIVNASPSGSSLTRIFNFSLNRESAAQFSQNITIDCTGGCVINFTARVNDTAGNFRTNDTIITVFDNIAPIVNVSINNTSPKINEFINISANITDETGLSTANITINFSTGKVYMNYTLSGKSQTINNATQITDIRGHVLNITVYATDTTNNVKQNSTLITVANTPAGQATIVLPA